MREHWFKVLMGLVVLLFAGLFLWLRSAQKAAQENIVPVAAASENIEQAIPEVTTEAIESKSPSALLEEQRKAELEARTAAPLPTGEEVASAFVTDTAGQAQRRRQQNPPQVLRQEGRAAPEEEERTPRRYPSPGQFQARLATGSRGGGWSGTGNNALPPQYDRDGTPFETNPEILRMLAASSPQTRQVYEQTTGRRYREPGSGSISNPAQVPPPPGSDGFNTYKVTAGRSTPGTGGYTSGDPLTPDVFFKCVVSGEQKIRTGSVVVMRLLEDAVISGVTFPRNLVFAGVAKVDANRVTLQIDRLGPTRVKADIFDYNYMPGIMIDPEKRMAKDVDRGLGDLQRQTSQEISTAIDRSVSGANSVLGVAGRVAANVVSRPRTRQRLRDVLLPDGYPLLITSAAAGEMDATSRR
ncbi:conjugative transposon protein TraM [Rufibacter immobilis]|uniref:conjugative transposon protein TraM n=1 Tax=Rufibacter immobilis TaxID=1348778 RepID=UPI0035F071C0